MRIIQSSRQQILFASCMQRKHLRVAFPAIARSSAPAQSAGCRMCLRPRLRNTFPVLSRASTDEQIHLARQSRQRRQRHAPGVIFQHQFRNKNRIAQIRKRIVESLTRMNLSERIQVTFRVFADSHGCSTLATPFRTPDVATKGEPSRQPRPRQTCWRRLPRRAPRAPQRRLPKPVSAKADGATARIHNRLVTSNAHPHPLQLTQVLAWFRRAQKIDRR